MWNIGIVELIVVGSLLVLGWVAGVIWPPARRWAAVVPLAALVATAVTPADLFSTLLVAAACVAFFAAGRRRTAGDAASPRPAGEGA